MQYLVLWQFCTVGETGIFLSKIGQILPFYYSYWITAVGADSDDDSPDNKTGMVTKTWSNTIEKLGH